jgi:hypothetical protein
MAGALLAETAGRFFLVGNPKEPCDFAAAGFAEPPVPLDAVARPWVELEPIGTPELAEPILLLEVEGEALPRLLSSRLLIERNGSVSERLWRLVAGLGPEGNNCGPGRLVPARWLGEIPDGVWRVVREAVLRCS